MLKFQDLSIIDNLKERIDTLENKIQSNDDLISDDVKNIVDSLLETNSLMNASLSGRDKVNAIMKRLDELEKYLDPTFESIDMSTLNAKLEIIVSSEPELRKNADALEKLNELSPVLNSTSLQEIPNLTSQLQRLTVVSLQNQDQVEKMSEQTIELIQQYNSIMQNMTKSFAQINELISQYENEQLINKNKEE